MRESMWGIFVVGVGVGLILLIYFFQGVTNTDEHNYYLLRETTEAAMQDAVDMVDYRVNNIISINREKFVESFIRRSIPAVLLPLSQAACIATFPPLIAPGNEVVPSADTL